jgi:N-acyl-D-amino-acid deacylase
MAADLVIFDPDTVSDRSTYEDGRRLAEGIDYVAVNGKLVLDAGTMTPVRPGRVLKAS